MKTGKHLHNISPSSHISGSFFVADIYVDVFGIHSRKHRTNDTNDGKHYPSWN